MKTVANILKGLIAALHFGVLILEMFFRHHPDGQRIFNLTLEFSAPSAVFGSEPATTQAKI